MRKNARDDARGQREKSVLPDHHPVSPSSEHTHAHASGDDGFM